MIYSSYFYFSIINYNNIDIPYLVETTKVAKDSNISFKTRYVYKNEFVEIIISFFACSSYSNIFSYY